MTGAQRWAAESLAVVLDLPPASLRADSPLDDLGADSVARIQWADVVEQAVAAQTGVRIAVDDHALASARTLGELAATSRS